MRSFRKFFVFIVLVLALGIVNFFFRKKLKNGYGEVLTYNSLYSVKEQFNGSRIGSSGKDSRWAWKMPFPYAGNEELARLYISDSMQVRPQDSSAKKVIKISKYILGITTGRFGQPSEALNNLSPLEQLNFIREGRSKLYCGNYAVIFAYFANLAGIPTRIIQVGTKANGFPDGIHVFNEVYLSETGNWAYVDLTDGNIFIMLNGRLLNALDVHRLLRYDRESGICLTALHFQADSLVKLPFRQASFFGSHDINVACSFLFYNGDYLELTNSRNVFQKLEHLLYPYPYYAFYSDNIDVPAYPFYLRLWTEYVFLFGLAIGGIWAGILVFFKYFTASPAEK